MIDEVEWASNLRLPNPLGLLGDPLSLHPGAFLAEIHDDGEAGEDEKQACFER